MAKYLDQTGLKALINGLNEKYRSEFAAKTQLIAGEISFTENGNMTGVTNVQDAIDVLVKNVVIGTEKISATTANVDGLATRVDAVEDLADANKGALDILKGDVNTAGSVAKAVKDAIDDEVDRVDKKISDDIAAQAATQKTKDDAQDAKIKALEDLFGDAEENEAGGILDRVATAEGDIDVLQAAVADMKDATKDGSLAKQIADEVTARQQADSGLDERLQAVEGAIGDGGALEARVAANEEDIARLDGAVDVEGSVKKQIKDAITEVNGAAETLAGRVEALETFKNTTYPAAEAKVREDFAAADAQVLADAKKHADDAITALVDSAPDAMNTLNELAKAINDNQGVYDAYVAEHAQAMAQQKTDLQAEIDADVKVEKERAEGQEAAIRQEFAAADTALHTAISAEIDADVAAEAALREAADTALQAAVDAKVAQADYDAKVEDFEDRIAANEAFVTAQPAKDQAQDDRIAALEAVVDVDGDTVDAKIEAAAGKADAAQGEIDALEAIVGAKAEGENAATGIFADIAALQADVDQNETDCDNAIKAEKERAEAAEKANADAIAAINNAESGILKQAKDYTDTKFNEFIALTDEEVQAAIDAAFGTQA